MKQDEQVTALLGVVEQLTELVKVLTEMKKPEPCRLSHYYPTYSPYIYPTYPSYPQWTYTQASTGVTITSAICETVTQ